MYTSVNWLGDYFAWTIRVENSNNFTVHEYFKSFTIHTMVYFRCCCCCFCLCLLILHSVFSSSLLLYCLCWFFWRLPLKWYRKWINTIMAVCKENKKEEEEKEPLHHCHHYRWILHFCQNFRQPQNALFKIVRIGCILLCKVGANSNSNNKNTQFILVLWEFKQRK